MDGDGDMDVLSASQLDNKIAWYENDGSQTFALHTISTAASGARSVFAADVDGDGDLDVLSASGNDDKIAWYEDYKSFELHNTIVAGNLCGADPDDLSGDPVQAVSSSNVVGDAASSGGLVGGNQGNIVGVANLDWLEPLGDNGGPTPTHALLPGSPAIDAGNGGSGDRSVGSALTTDQRGDGFARIVGGGVDIGAFECQSFVVSTLVDENDGNYSPGHLSLREALGLAAADPAKDEIRFSPSLAGGTITLALGQLEITSNLDLLGLGVTLDAASHSRVLYVSAAATDASVRDLTITGGYTVSNNSGGGIRNDGTLSVINSTIADNSSGWTGGGIYNEGTLWLVNSTVSGNGTRAGSYSGGGIRNQLGTVWVVNSTISGNSSAALGGGIFNYGTLSVTNSTIADNTAYAYGDYTTGAGGGIATYDYGAIHGSTTLHNTIVAGNVRSTAASDDDLSGNPVEDGSSYNLIGNAAGSGGLIDGHDGNIVGVADLLWLAPLGDYGGTTQTHALLPGNPAINQGDNARAVDPWERPLTTDQRGAGRARVVGGAVDIGAFEVQTIVSTLADEDDGDHSPGDLSLREALGLAASTSNPGKDEIRFAPGLAGGTITLDARWVNCKSPVISTCWDRALLLTRQATAGCWPSTSA